LEPKENESLRSQNSAKPLNTHYGVHDHVVAKPYLQLHTRVSITLLNSFDSVASLVSNNDALLEELKKEACKIGRFDCGRLRIPTCLAKRFGRTALVAYAKAFLAKS